MSGGSDAQGERGGGRVRAVLVRDEADGHGVAGAGLLTRLPGLRMTVPMSELEFREGQAIASIRELPVTWDDA